jgi:hypothetical protein
MDLEMDIQIQIYIHKEVIHPIAKLKLNQLQNINHITVNN